MTTTIVTSDRDEQSLGAVIRTARRAAGLSQCDLAALVPVCHVHISNIERGRRRPSPDVARRIGTVLGIDLDVEEKRCSVAGCDRPFHAREWCKLHYYRARARGFS